MYQYRKKFTKIFDKQEDDLNKEETEILCLNCHADRSDLQKDHPRQVDNPPHILEVIAHLLSTLADHMLMMADRIYDIVAQLMSFHKTLATQVAP